MPSVQLRKRCLFLLRVLLISDVATNESRHQLFQNEMSYVTTRGIDKECESDAEVREMGLQMLRQLLMMDSQQSNDDQGNNTPTVARTIIQFHKNDISRLGIQRIKEIRNLKEGSEMPCWNWRNGKV